MYVRNRNRCIAVARMEIQAILSSKKLLIFIIANILFELVSIRSSTNFNLTTYYMTDILRGVNTIVATPLLMLLCCGDAIIRDRNSKDHEIYGTTLGSIHDYYWGKFFGTISVWLLACVVSKIIDIITLYICSNPFSLQIVYDNKSILNYMMILGTNFFIYAFPNVLFCTLIALFIEQVISKKTLLYLTYITIAVIITILGENNSNIWYRNFLWIGGYYQSIGRKTLISDAQIITSIIGTLLFAILLCVVGVYRMKNHLRGKHI